LSKVTQTLNCPTGRAVPSRSRDGDDINEVTSVGEIDGRWGEFEDDAVGLNWRLVLAPVRIQDHVLAHELAHAVHGEHDDAFWNTVGTLVPDYEDRREWLRLHGNTLTV
jgi:hypothetical protein